jgi:hypothetical protein
VTRLSGQPIAVAKSTSSGAVSLSRRRFSLTRTGARRYTPRSGCSDPVQDNDNNNNNNDNDVDRLNASRDGRGQDRTGQNRAVAAEDWRLETGDRVLAPVPSLT